MGHSRPLAPWKVVSSTPSSSPDKRRSDRSPRVKDPTVAPGSSARWSSASSRSASRAAPLPAPGRSAWLSTARAAPAAPAVAVSAPAPSAQAASVASASAPMISCRSARASITAARRPAPGSQEASRFLTAGSSSGLDPARAATGMPWRSSARRRGDNWALLRASTAWCRHGAPGRRKPRTRRASTAASSCSEHSATVGAGPEGLTAGWGSRPRTRPAASQISGVERKLVRSCSTAQPGRWRPTSPISPGSAPFQP